VLYLVLYHSCGALGRWPVLKTSTLKSVNEVKEIIPRRKTLVYKTGEFVEHQKEPSQN
jgi:hypothetical protein